MLTGNTSQLTVQRLCSALDSHGTETMQCTWQSWYRDYAAHLSHGTETMQRTWVMVQRLCGALESWYRDYAAHLSHGTETAAHLSHGTETVQHTLVMVQRLQRTWQSRYRDYAVQLSHGTETMQCSWVICPKRAKTTPEDLPWWTLVMNSCGELLWSTAITRLFVMNSYSRLLW
jgi:hypothetical protein